MPLKLSKPRPLDTAASMAQMTQQAIEEAQTMRRAPKNAQPLTLPPESANFSLPEAMLRNDKMQEAFNRLPLAKARTPVALSPKGIPLPGDSSPAAASPAFPEGPTPPITDDTGLFDAPPAIPAARKPVATLTTADDWAAMPDTGRQSFQGAMPPPENRNLERLRVQMEQERTSPRPPPTRPQVMATVENPTPKPHRDLDAYGDAVTRLTDVSRCLWSGSGQVQRDDFVEWCTQVIDDLMMQRYQPQTTMFVSRFWQYASKMLGLPDWTAMDTNARRLIIDKAIHLAGTAMVYDTLVGIELTSREQVPVSSPQQAFYRWSYLLLFSAMIQVGQKAGRLLTE